MKEKMTSCPVCGSAIKQDFCPRCLYLPPLPKQKKGEGRELNEILKAGDTMIGHFYLTDLVSSAEWDEDSLSGIGRTVRRKFEKQEERLLQIVAAFENSDVIDVGRFDDFRKDSGETFDSSEKETCCSSDRTEEEQREYSTEFENNPGTAADPEEISVSDFDIMASLIAEDPEEDSFSDSFMSGLLGETEEEPFPDEDSWGEDQVVGRTEETRVTDCITDVLDEEGNIVSPVGERERDLFSDRDHPVRLERENSIKRERRERQMRTGLNNSDSDREIHSYENYTPGMVRPGVFSSREDYDGYGNPSATLPEDERDFIYSEMLGIDSPDDEFFESDRKEEDQSGYEGGGLFGRRRTDKSSRNRVKKEDNYSFIDRNVDSYYLDKDMPDDLEDGLEKKKMSKVQLKQAAIFGSVAMLGVGMMIVPFL